MDWWLSLFLTFLLISYASYKNSLTFTARPVAVMIAGLHAYHPWSVYFVFLGVFFLSGVLVTKVKHAQKVALTASSSGGSSEASAPSPRGYMQVLANSLPATIFILLHRQMMFARLREAPSFLIARAIDVCLPYPMLTPGSFSNPTLWIAIGNLAPYAVIGAYAAATADTFSSELGILSSQEPFLITSLLRGRVQRVPRGTNGGVTILGLLSGLLGGALIGFVAFAGLPFCDGSSDLVEKRTAFVNVYSLDRLDTKAKRWTMQQRLILAGVTAIWGLLGSTLDSILGAYLQASVIEVRSGKVIEGEGGKKVLVDATEGKKEDDPRSRKVLVGRDILSNNGVNMATGFIMGAGAILAMIVFLGGPNAITKGTGIKPLTPPMVTGKSRA